MSVDRLAAAAGLAAILEQENVALERVDYAAATALLPAKEAALAALATGDEPDGSAPPEAAALGQRLAVLALRNRALLEQAMAVQSRVVGIIVAAMRQHRDEAYGPGGRQPAASHPGAMTLSRRA